MCSVACPSQPASGTMERQAAMNINVCDSGLKNSSQIATGTKMSSQLSTSEENSLVAKFCATNSAPAFHLYFLLGSSSTGSPGIEQSGGRRIERPATTGTEVFKVHRQCFGPVVDSFQT